ncbi:hypothetical protein ILUMI_16094 [Ignelater luminosus]|uniref:PiggyBac transposable element-derived protein domain-containing protein n=1 Tax=Ignelater luminosus TaxID=2038154 RepID=A0A8K0CMC6_IGNLU|nr:hypothetical protein ILUMI_16094 [Ignelater luminosus]
MLRSQKPNQVKLLLSSPEFTEVQSSKKRSSLRVNIPIHFEYEDDLMEKDFLDISREKILQQASEKVLADGDNLFDIENIPIVYLDNDTEQPETAKDEDERKAKGEEEAEESEEHDRLHKIRLVTEHVIQRLHIVPYETNLSIYEQMCSTKAKNYLRQYMPAKPHKWGYKLFCLAWDFWLL